MRWLSICLSLFFIFIEWGLYVNGNIEKHEPSQTYTDIMKYPGYFRPERHVANWLGAFLPETSRMQARRPNIATLANYRT